MLPKNKTLFWEHFYWKKKLKIAYSTITKPNVIVSLHGNSNPDLCFTLVDLAVENYFITVFSIISLYEQKVNSVFNFIVSSSSSIPG